MECYLRVDLLAMFLMGIVSMTATIQVIHSLQERLRQRERDVFRPMRQALARVARWSIRLGLAPLVFLILWGLTTLMARIVGYSACYVGPMQAVVVVVSLSVVPMMVWVWWQLRKSRRHRADPGTTS